MTITQRVLVTSREVYNNLQVNSYLGKNTCENSHRSVSTLCQSANWTSVELPMILN